MTDAGNRASEAWHLKQQLNAEEALRQQYKGGMVDDQGFHKLSSLEANRGAVIDVNSLYSSELVNPSPAVKAAFTAKRRSKRPRREVETMAFLSAARRFIMAAGKRVGEGDEFELHELLALREVLEEATAIAVAGQRSYGKSWAAIAFATGTSREAAFQRWGKKK